MATTALPVSGARRTLKDNLTLSAFWFGSSAHWALLLVVMIPSDVRRLVGKADSPVYLGVLLGWFALVALILPPFIGALSDRVGRRRPFIVGGVALNLVGLGIMVFAPGFWTYALGYLFVQLGNNVATSPFNALIPDVVPEAERGAASGVMGVLTLTGQITGFAINIALSSSRSGQFLAIAVLLAASALISVLGTPEPKRHAVSVERPDWLAFLRPEYRDFRWVTLTRFFNEVGKYSVQPFLNYYLADVIAAFTIGGFVIANKDMATSLVAGLLTVSGAVTAVWGGNVSDRVGKKPIIYLAGGLMGAAALGFALAHTYALVLVFAVVFGLGYGAYMSVDWALGTAVLPNRRTLARDMGVWHIAMVLPQVFNAAEGRFLDWGNAQSPNLGYSLIFGVAILFFLFGTVFIAQVRGVK